MESKHWRVLFTVQVSMEDHVGILQCTYLGALLSFGTGQIVYESMVPISYTLQANFIELRLQVLE